MADNDDTRGRWWGQYAYLAAVVGVSVLIDPVQRRNSRQALERALRWARATLDAPVPPVPSAVDVAHLHDEARRITKEAPGAGTT